MPHCVPTLPHLGPLPPLSCVPNLRNTYGTPRAPVQSLLLAHSVQRPPHSVGVFTLAELKLITDFALTYYYSKFKLYRYAFTLRHVKHLSLKTSHA